MSCTLLEKFLSFQNGAERAEFLIKQALNEDERGRIDDALPLYTDAAELCMKTVSLLLIRLFIDQLENCCFIKFRVFFIFPAEQKPAR